ncbi:RICIN domain-containing protein [Streptomyces sp. NPDC001889]
MFVRLAGTGAAMAFGSALLVGAETSAQAAPVNYQVVNGNSRNACLQLVNVSADRKNLVLATCDRSAKQVWRIAGGVFSNPASGFCLDGDGADVYALRCNGGGYQKWTTTSGSPKSIRHNQSGRYLHADGEAGDQVVFKPTKATASRWVLDRL